jgi:lysophospholipase L1-like esterase
MTVSSWRTRRTAAALVAGGVVVALAATAPAMASTAKHHHSPQATKKNAPVIAGSRYLALGDSIPFGFRESNSIPAPDYTKTKTFVGFPEDVAKNLGLKVANAACPGETTVSFLNTSGQSNGCENTYPAGGPAFRANFPLHVKYKNAHQSQLAFAQAYLKAHPNTRLVTLMLGANDGFLCQKQTSDGCFSEIGTVQKKLTKNLTKIFKALRKGSGYAGQIVLVNYFSLNYSNPTDNLESQALNTAENEAAGKFGVRVADGYKTFKKATKQTHGDVCKAQLLTALSGADAGTCGVHPSVAGQALLAQTVEQAIKK